MRPLRAEVFVRRVHVTNGAAVGASTLSQIIEEAYFEIQYEAPIYVRTRISEEGATYRKLFSDSLLTEAWRKSPLAMLGAVQLRCGADDDETTFQLSPEVTHGDTNDSDTPVLILFPDRRDPLRAWFGLFEDERESFVTDRTTCSDCVLRASLLLSNRIGGREQIPTKHRVKLADIMDCVMHIETSLAATTAFVGPTNATSLDPEIRFRPRLPLLRDMHVVSVATDDTSPDEESDASLLETRDGNFASSDDQDATSAASNRCEAETEAFRVCANENDDLGRCAPEQRAYMRCQKSRYPSLNEGSSSGAYDDDHGEETTSRGSRPTSALPDHLPLENVPVSMDANGDVTVSSGSSFKYRFKALACAARQGKGCPAKAVIPPALGIPALPAWLPGPPGLFGFDFSQLAGLIITCIINGVLGAEIQEQVHNFHTIAMKVLPPILNLALVVGLPDPMMILGMLEQLKAELMAKLNAIKAMLALAQATVNAQIAQLNAALDLARMMAASALAQVQAARAALQAMIDQTNALIAAMAAQIKAAAEAAIAAFKAALAAAKAALQALIAGAMAAALAALADARAALAAAQSAFQAAQNLARANPFDVDLQRDAEKKAEDVEAAEAAAQAAMTEVDAKTAERDKLTVTITSTMQSIEAETQKLKGAEDAARAKVKSDIAKQQKTVADADKAASAASAKVAALEAEISRLETKKKAQEAESKSKETEAERKALSSHFDKSSHANATIERRKRPPHLRKPVLISIFANVTGSANSTLEERRIDADGVLPSDRSGGGNVVNWQGSECAREEAHQWIALNWPGGHPMRLTRVRLVVGMHKERVGECSHRNDTRSSFAMYVRSYDEGIRAEPGSWERVMGMQGPTVFDGEILDINMTRSLPCEASLRIDTLQLPAIPAWRSVEVWGYASDERTCAAPSSSSSVTAKNASDVSLLELAPQNDGEPLIFAEGETRVETEAEAKMRAALWAEAEAKVRAGDGGSGSLAETVATDVIHELTSHLARELTVRFTKDMTPRITDAVTNQLRAPMRTYLIEHLSRSVSASTSTALSTVVPQALNALLPSHLLPTLTATMTHTLTRALTHSLAPTLVHTLKGGSMEKLACYQCATTRQNCERCDTLAEGEMASTLSRMDYFADYYSDYFADYYAGSLDTESGLEGPPSATYEEHEKPPNPSARAKETPKSKGAFQRPFDTYSSPLEKGGRGASVFNSENPPVASSVKR
eukprot:g1383.t1